MRVACVRRFAWLVWLIVATAGAGGCAARGAVAADSYTPPKMVRNSAPHPMQLSESLATWVGADVTIEVLIDGAGVPKMSTLQVTGRRATENRDVIAHWVQSARYVPAQREGQPVEGVFRTRIESRSSRTRRG